MAWSLIFHENGILIVDDASQFEPVTDQFRSWVWRRARTRDPTLITATPGELVIGMNCYDFIACSMQLTKTAVRWPVIIAATAGESSELHAPLLKR